MRISRCATIAVLIVATTCLAACGSSGGTTPPATTVSGACSAGGSPLDGNVTVTYTPDGGGTPVMFTTATDGSYSGSIGAGTWDVVASRPGYTDATAADVVVAAEVNTITDLILIALAPNTYIGSLSCSVCHAAYYATFRRSGHPYKINKIDDLVPAAPTYPFSSLAGVDVMIADDGLEIPADPPDPAVPDPNGTMTDNTLGKVAHTWADLTYVIGGYYWKARFIDAGGYIVTGSGVQYNFATTAMVGYHNNEVDKVFNCGNCHTTGWRHYDATVSPTRQDGLAGMDGSFAEPGIQCEACHGAGSLHAQTKVDTDITLIATARTPADYADGMYAYGKAIACGECHTRDGEHDYSTFVSPAEGAGWVPTDFGWPANMGGRIAASGGLVKHHEQYDEIVGIDPSSSPLASVRSAGFIAAHGDCMTCHTDPHLTTVNRDVSGDLPGVDDSNTFCMTAGCHPDKDPNLRQGGMKTLNCVDCHMPKMAKSATSTTSLDTGITTGDVTSHIFRIDISTANSAQFVGSFSNPWITVDWACRSCHGVGGLFDVGPSDTFVMHNN